MSLTERSKLQYYNCQEASLEITQSISFFVAPSTESSIVSLFSNFSSNLSGQKYCYSEAPTTTTPVTTFDNENDQVASSPSKQRVHQQSSGKGTPQPSPHSTSSPFYPGLEIKSAPVSDLNSSIINKNNNLQADSDLRIADSCPEDIIELSEDTSIELSSIRKTSESITALSSNHILLPKKSSNIYNKFDTFESNQVLSELDDDVDNSEEIDSDQQSIISHPELDLNQLAEINSTAQKVAELITTEENIDRHQESVRIKSSTTLDKNQQQSKPFLTTLSLKSKLSSPGLVESIVTGNLDSKGPQTSGELVDPGGGCAGAGKSTKKQILGEDYLLDREYHYSNFINSPAAATAAAGSGTANVVGSHTIPKNIKFMDISTSGNNNNENQGQSQQNPQQNLQQQQQQTNNQNKNDLMITSPQSINPKSDQSQLNTTTTTTSMRQISTTSHGNEERFKPITTGRTLIIQRTPSSLSQNSLCGRSSAMGTGWRSATLPLCSTNTGCFMPTGVNNIIQGREKDKRDLQQLNERFANYIEKVRFLDAQNRKLANELNSLRERWGKETERVKAMYGVEMEQLRQLLNSAERIRAELELKINAYEEAAGEMQQEIDETTRQLTSERQLNERLNQQLSESEAELNSLRRKMVNFVDERNRHKAELRRLRDELKNVKSDLDSETMAHLNVENELQSLRDELTFVRQVHESEIKELSTLACRDTTQENRDFWKNEMSQALRDIQLEYDNKMEMIRGELESFYQLKIQDVRSTTVRGNFETIQLREENNRIKNQIVELRKRLPDLEARNVQLERLLNDARQDLDERTRESELERNILRKDLQNANVELERTLAEFQAIVDAKLSLELEIAAYRKLLESEENRYSGKSSIGNGFHKNEGSSKTSYTRSAKGNVSISECSPDGKYIVLENNGKKREDISGMKIVRHIDHDRSVVMYTIPQNIVLEPDGRGRTTKIWAKNLRPMSACKDLETLENSWGTGTYVRTVLLNPEGEERASHTQRTIYHMGIA